MKGSVRSVSWSKLAKLVSSWFVSGVCRLAVRFMRRYERRYGGMSVPEESKSGPVGKVLAGPVQAGLPDAPVCGHGDVVLVRISPDAPGVEALKPLSGWTDRFGWLNLARCRTCRHWLGLSVEGQVFEGYVEHEVAGPVGSVSWPPYFRQDSEADRPTAGSDPAVPGADRSAVYPLPEPGAGSVMVRESGKEVGHARAQA